MTEKKNKSGLISRREFLKDAGLLVGGTAIGSTILLTACGGDTTTETVTSTETVTTTAAGGTATTTKTVTVTGTQGQPVAADNKISFTVNGYAYEVAVEPNWTLQYLLHDVLGFIDIKTFCYRGACGSCTVIVDGRPVLSCMMLAVNADGKTIETAQGIAEANHPLVDSYVKYECMQCGYCTPGFLATAKALLDRNPEPTEDEIIEALSGNLCRCGTYPAHIRAINEASSVLKGGA